MMIQELSSITGKRQFTNKGLSLVYVRHSKKHYFGLLCVCVWLSLLFFLNGCIYTSKNLAQEEIQIDTVFNTIQAMYVGIRCTYLYTAICNCMYRELELFLQRQTKVLKCQSEVTFSWKLVRTLLWYGSVFREKFGCCLSYDRESLLNCESFKRLLHQPLHHNFWHDCCS